jgi:hypothetical protein
MVLQFVAKARQRTGSEIVSMWRGITLTIASAGVALLPSCKAPKASAPVTSDRSADPGAVPTSESSFEMLRVDPPARRADFQRMLNQLGKRCGSVTEAILKGGFEGTDFWKIDCADSGEWLLAFSAQGTTVVSCDQSPKECSNAWLAVHP